MAVAHLSVEEIVTNIVMNVFKNGNPSKINGTLEKYPTFNTDIISYQEHFDIWKVAKIVTKLSYW